MSLGVEEYNGDYGEDQSNQEREIREWLKEKKRKIPKRSTEKIEKIRKKTTRTNWKTTYKKKCKTTWGNQGRIRREGMHWLITGVDL